MKTTVITISNFKKYEGYMMDPGNEKGTKHIGIETSEGEVVGTATFTRYETHVQLTAIYVRPEFRRQGAGHQLMAMIRDVINKSGYLPILVDFSDESEGLGQFLESEGFFISPGNVLYEFSVEDAVAKVVKRKGERDDFIRPLSDMTSQDAVECAEFMDNTGWDRSDLLDPDVRRDLSFAAYLDDEICGIIVVSEFGDKVLSIDRIAADNRKNMIFTALARASFQAMRMTEKRGTVAQFVGANDKLVKITSLTLGDKLRTARQYYTAVG